MSWSVDRAAQRVARGWVRSGVLCLVVSAAGAALAQQPSATPQQLFDVIGLEKLNERAELVDAIAKFEKREFDAALESLKAANSKYPDLPPARALLARLLFRANQIPAAQAVLEQAVVESPEDAEAYVMLGDIAFASQRVTEASLLYERAGTLTDAFKGDEKRKTNLDARFRAGMTSVCEARRNWEQAKSHLEAWLKLDPENSLAHHRLGVVLYQMKPDDPQEAIKEIQAAAAKTDRLPPYPITMMRLAEQSGQRDKAKQWAEFAISKNGDNLQTRLGVARWAWETGQLDDAKKHADAATELDANSLDAKILRGVIARYLGGLEEAERYLDEAKLQEPGNFTATDQLALTLVESKEEAKRNRARELAEINFRNNQQSPEAAWTLGWIYYRNGRLNEAARLMNAAAVSGPVTADSAFYLACVSKELGNKDRVKEFLTAALTSTGPFANRKAAEKMQNDLTKPTANEGQK